MNFDGSFARCKALLVSDSAWQKTCIICCDTFSPVVKLTTIRTVLSLAVSKSWCLHQLDVKNSFLHSRLSKTVYMHQPLGFRDFQHLIYVCLLKISIYGLKQVHMLYINILQIMFAPWIVLIVSQTTPSSFTDKAYLLLYADGIILTTSSVQFCESIIASLNSEFAMKDLDSLSYFFFSVTRNSFGLFLFQKKYSQ